MAHDLRIFANLSAVRGVKSIMKKQVVALGVAASAALALVGCGGGGGSAPAPVGPILLLVQNGTTIVKYNMDNGATTTLGSGSNVRHVRISPDGTRYLAQIGGNLVLGSTSSTTYTTLTGYKLGDWQSGGNRILAVNNGNVVFQLTSNGTTLESVFNGNFGTGISSIDASDAANQFLITYNVTGWAQLAKVSYVGGAPTFITSAGLNSYNGRWNEAGTAVLAHTAETGDSDVITLNADATGNTTLTASTDAEWDAVFGVGSTVYYARAGSIYTMTTTGSSVALYYGPGATLRLGDIYQP